MSPADFAELIDALPEAYFLATLDGEILAANRAAGALLGRPARELTGVRLDEHLTDAQPVLHSFLKRAAGSRSMMPGRLTLRAADGKRRTCRCDAALLRPATADAGPLLLIRAREVKETDRFLLLNRKIDELSREIRRRMQLEEERAQLLEAEREARAAAEEANRLKDDFLATLSHELRTPLNAILGWASMLRDGQVAADKVEQAYLTIERAAKALAQLIDDLLDLSRILAGRLRMELRPVDLTDVVQTAVETLRPTAEAKQVRLVVLIDPGAGPVSGDADRLQQVVWNLVANAIKFTPRSGRVQVRVERVNSHVEIVVSDTGEGIEPEFLPYIFDRFRQGDPGRTRLHGGLGLGLAIVKHLVELHGGVVYAESQGKGLGSTFTVMLPLMILQRPGTFTTDLRVHPTAEIEVGAVEGVRLDGVRILVVEDDPDSRQMLGALFTQFGAAVQLAPTIAEAWRQIEETRPELIVSDIEMPDEDGYTFIRKLRALPPERGGRIPAVALTAFARMVDRLRALQAGFQMHVPKPVEPSELVMVVASLTDRHLPR